MEASNVKAMRDALVWLQKTGYRSPEGGWMCITLKMTQKDGKPYPIEVPPYAEDVINTALATPPRNCDLFATWEDALLVFREKTGNRKPFELWLGCEIQAFAIWLYATAKPETKGERMEEEKWQYDSH